MAHSPYRTPEAPKVEFPPMPEAQPIRLDPKDWWLRQVWFAFVGLTALLMLCYTAYRIARCNSPWYAEEAPAAWVDEEPYELLTGGANGR